MSAFFSDLRFAVRQLRRDPGFAVVVILTLGIGIGAAPAFQASNDNFEQTLRGGERIVTGGSRMVRLLENDLGLDAVALAGPRLNATLVGLFATAALGLAALGIYGVTALA